MSKYSVIFILKDKDELTLIEESNKTEIDFKKTILEAVNKNKFIMINELIVSTDFINQIIINKEA